MNPQKASPEQLDKLGELAATLVKNGDRVALGSGKASLAFVRGLGRRMQTEKLELQCVPTSILTEETARNAGIPLLTLHDVDAFDIAIDGADEVDPNLNVIKGGGGNLAREKITESIAKRFVLVVGEEKIVDRLGTTFPVFVECIEFGRPVVTRRLQALGATVEQRKNKDGSPFLTDNGNPYLEVKFHRPPLALPNTTQLQNPAEADKAIRAIPGVLETGLFINMASEVLIAYADGRIEHKRRA